MITSSTPFVLPIPGLSWKRKLPELLFPDRSCTIGTSAHCDVVLPNKARCKCLSSLHARIFYDEVTDTWAACGKLNCIWLRLVYRSGNDSSCWTTAATEPALTVSCTEWTARRSLLRSIINIARVTSRVKCTRRSVSKCPRRSRVSWTNVKVGFDAFLAVCLACRVPP